MLYFKKQFFLSGLIALIAVGLIVFVANAVTTIKSDELDISGTLTMTDSGLNIISTGNLKQNGVEILIASTTTSNLFMGYNTGSVTAAGTYNTAVGSASIQDDSTGSYNSAMGVGSLQGNTTGSYNIAVGYVAGYQNTDGDWNTAVGYAPYATSTERSVIIGVDFRYTEGERNVYANVANRPHSNVSYGSRNVNLGHRSGASNTSGSYNVIAGGYFAGHDNYTGSNNIFFNTSAGRYNVTGSNNIAFGYEAAKGASGNSFSNNTVVGYRAAKIIRTSSNNIIFGRYTADNLTTGSNNIIIGDNIDAPSATADNQLDIGNTIYGDLSSQQIGVATANPSSTFVVDGSFSRKYLAKTADYTLTVTDSVLGVDATTAETTMTLPTAVGIAGRIYTIKKTDASGNAVIIDGNGAETIDGSATYSLGAQWKYVTIASNGTNWLITANN